MAAKRRRRKATTKRKTARRRSPGKAQNKDLMSLALHAGIGGMAGVLSGSIPLSAGMRSVARMGGAYLAYTKGYPMVAAGLVAFEASAQGSKVLNGPQFGLLPEHEQVQLAEATGAAPLLGAGGDGIYAG